MAINPPSDIVLGAILAADPSKYRAAADRLRRAAGDTGSQAAASVATPGGSAGWRTSTAPETISADAQSQRATSTPPARGGKAGKPPDAFAQLEAFVLQSFIQTMLPKNSQTFFGKGTAGEVWKSMLAEKLGAQIASSNQVGLAKRLAAGQSDAVAGSVPAAAFGNPARTSASLMSVLPYIRTSTSAAVDDPPTGENVSMTERS